MYMCVHVWQIAHVYTRRQLCCLHDKPSTFFKTGSFIGLKHTMSADWLASELQGASYLYLLSVEITDMYYGVVGIFTQVLG